MRTFVEDFIPKSVRVPIGMPGSSHSLEPMPTQQIVEGRTPKASANTSGGSLVIIIIIIIINPLTARVVGAPQMILQQLFSSFLVISLPMALSRSVATSDGITVLKMWEQPVCVRCTGSYGLCTLNNVHVKTLNASTSIGFTFVTKWIQLHGSAQGSTTAFYKKFPHNTGIKCRVNPM